MKVNWSKRTLNFKLPVGTSRGVMKTRDVWFISLSQGGKIGIGECAPLLGLSLDNFNQIEKKLDEMCKNPNLFINDLSFNNVASILNNFTNVANIDGLTENFFSNLIQNLPLNELNNLASINLDISGNTASLSFEGNISPPPRPVICRD